MTVELTSAILDSSGQPFTANQTPKVNHYVDGKPAIYGGVPCDATSVAIGSPWDGLKHPGVWKCVNFISKKVAKTPIYVHRADQEIDRNHLAHYLINHEPNETHTAYNFRLITTQHAAYWGESGSFIVRDESARPIALIPFTPDRFCVGVLYDGNARTSLYSFAYGDKWYHNVDPFDVYHLVGWTHDGIHSLPFWKIHAETLGLGLTAQKFAASYYNNGAPLAVVTKPAGLNPDPASEQHRNFISSYQEFIEGFGKKYRVMFVNNANDYKAIDTNAEKSQMHPAREMSLLEVALLFGLQPFSVGLDQSGPYNSLSERVTIEIESLNHWFCLHEQETRKKLLTEKQKRSESHYVSFDRDSLFDHETRIKIERDKLSSQLSTVNESRAKLKSPPIDGGDCILVAAGQVPLDVLCKSGVTKTPQVATEVAPDNLGNDAPGDGEPSQLQSAIDDAERRANQVIRRAINRKAKSKKPVDALSALVADPSKITKQVSQRYSFLEDGEARATEQVDGVLSHVSRIIETKPAEQVPVAIEATLEIVLN